MGLEIINIMNNDGSLNASAGGYSGLDRFEARKRLWADMQAKSTAPLCRPCMHGIVLHCVNHLLTCYMLHKR